MPLYEIQHHVPLTIAQRDELAEAITQLHSTRFTTPRMFVNVKFTDTQSVPTYVGGKRRQGNVILATVRTGPSRTHKDWSNLIQDIIKIWDSIAPLPQVRGSTPGLDYTLRGVVVFGGLVAGYEAGFLLPPAGGDVEWVRKNWDEFQRRAEAGDEEFQDLVEEVKSRNLLAGNSDADAARKVEAALGWGDAA